MTTAISKKWCDFLVSQRPDKGGEPPKWALYVRAMAVSHVLSYAVRWMAFLLLTGTAALLDGLRHQLDGWALGLGLGGTTCAILCPTSRWWFLRWGRKKYPPADDGNARDDGPQQPGA